MHKIKIAVDGHSSTGKSTLARSLAKRLAYTYIDSGAMYRAVTLYALENKLIDESGTIDKQKLESQLDHIEITFCFNEDQQKQDTCLNGRNVENAIRSLEVSQHVSPISELRFVRERLVALQRELSRNKGVVMDGRDIGTVVFPDAEVKIFMTADEDVRARRRFLELQEKGQAVPLDVVKKNIQQRDYIDQNRTESPLKQAVDAILVDNSFMTVDEQLIHIQTLVSERISALEDEARGL